MAFFTSEDDLDRTDAECFDQCHEQDNVSDLRSHLAKVELADIPPCFDVGVGARTREILASLASGHAKRPTATRHGDAQLAAMGVELHETRRGERARVVKLAVEDGFKEALRL